MNVVMGKGHPLKESLTMGTVQPDYNNRVTKLCSRSPLYFKWPANCVPKRTQTQATANWLCPKTDYYTHKFHCTKG